MISKVGIAPSILAADFSRLGQEIHAVQDGCEVLHIDVMDGVYVPNISFGVPVVKTIRPITDLIFDVHLMITDPRKYVETFVKVGADSITFHIECTDDPMGLIEYIRSFGIKAGIAIHPDMPMEKVVPFLAKGAVDLILLMSVYPGFGGQSYLPDTDEKLRFIRSELDKNGSEAILSVDGGITKETIVRAVSNGARLIVAGSAVFAQPDAGVAVKELTQIGLNSL